MSAIVGRVDAIFMNRRVRKMLLRLRIPLVLAAVVLVVLPNIDPRWMWPGLAISLLGEAIQVWAFANLDKKAELACRGPYALVRNPMYLGRFFVILGAAMLLGRAWVLAAFVVLYWFYMVNRVRREEETLRGMLGEPYVEYLAGANRFLPGRPYRGNPVLAWSWKLFRQNRAHWNLLATLAFWGIAIGWATRGAAS